MPDIHGLPSGVPKHDMVPKKRVNLCETGYVNIAYIDLKFILSVLTHARTHTHICTHTCMRTYTHTHAHTHTNTEKTDMANQNADTAASSTARACFPCFLHNTLRPYAQRWTCVSRCVMVGQVHLIHIKFINDGTATFTPCVEMLLHFNHKSFETKFPDSFASMLFTLFINSQCYEDLKPTPSSSVETTFFFFTIFIVTFHQGFC